MSTPTVAKQERQQLLTFGLEINHRGEQRRVFAAGVLHAAIGMMDRLASPG
jgi:dihydrodipicolinate reductase